MGAVHFSARSAWRLTEHKTSFSCKKTDDETNSGKRVLFWSERYWPTIGGVGISASNLLPALCERGYAFVVVTSKDYFELPENDYFEGIPFFIVFPSGPNWSKEM